MTEAGKQWVEEKIKPELEELFEEHALQTIPGMEERIREARQDHADFWLRAFCELLASRAEAEVQRVCFNRNWDGNKDAIFVDTFEALKRELLGE